MMEEPPLMREPTLEFRTEIAEAIDSVGSEEELEEVLSRIDATVAEFARLEDGDREINREEAEDLLAAAHSWASLGSYAVASFYGPQSPLRRDIAGWSKGAVKKLEGLAQKLRRPVEAAARSLGASAWSISTGFPWGVQISLEWSVR